MKPNNPQRLTIVPKSARRCALHHRGALRLEWVTDGVSIEAVRIRDGAVWKERIDLTNEEFTALGELLPSRQRENRRSA